MGYLNKAMGIMAGAGGIVSAAAPVAKEGVAQHYQKQAGKAQAEATKSLYAGTPTGKAIDTAADFQKKADKFRKAADKIRGNFDMEMFAYAQAMAQSQSSAKEEQENAYRARLGRIK